MAGVSATLDLEGADAFATIDAIESRLAGLSGSVEVTAEAGEVTGAVDAAVSAADTSVTVDADTASVTGEISAAVDGADATVPVDADASALTGEISAAVAAAETTVDVDVSGAEASLGALGGAAASAQDDLAELGEAAGPSTDRIGALTTATSGAVGSFRGAAGAAGAFSPALRGVAAAAASPVGALAALAAGTGLAVSQFGEAQAVTAITEQRIRATGGAAGVTAGEIASLASQIQSYSGFSDEAVGSAANLLLGFRSVQDQAGAGNDIFSRALPLLADVSRLMGTDMSSSATALGRALEDPVSGLGRLGRAGVRLTADQQELAISLAESGDLLGAQRVILDGVESQVGGVARAYGDTLPGQIDKAKQSFDELLETLGSFGGDFFGDVVEGAGIWADALNDIIGGAESGIDFLQQFGRGLGAGGDAATAAGGAIGAAVGSINGLTTATGIAVQEFRTFSFAAHQVEPAISALGQAAQSSIPTVADAFRDLNADGTVSLNEFGFSLQASAQQVARFSTDISTLIARGAPNLAAAFIQAGPQVAGAAAHTAASASTAYLAGLETITGQSALILAVEAASIGGMADILGASSFAAGLEAASSYIDAFGGGLGPGGFGGELATAAQGTLQQVSDAFASGEQIPAGLRLQALLAIAAFNDAMGPLPADVGTLMAEVTSILGGEAPAASAGASGGHGRSAFGAGLKPIVGDTTATMNATKAAIQASGGAMGGAGRLVGGMAVSGARSGVAPMPGVATSAVAGMIGKVRGQSGAARSGGSAVGAALGAGIAAGIASQVGNIINQAVSAVAAAVSAASGAAEKGSPSRLTTRLVGVPLGEGIAAGIIDAIPTIEAASRDAVQAAVQPVSPVSLAAVNFGAGSPGASGSLGAVVNFAAGAIVIHGGGDPVAVRAAVGQGVGDGLAELKADIRSA